VRIGRWGAICLWVCLNVGCQTGRDARISQRAVEDRASQSVVCIRTHEKGEPEPIGPTAAEGALTSQAGGTGLLVGEDGLILTNAHVLENVDQAVIVTHDGTAWPVRRWCTDDQSDLAILQIDGDRMPSLPLAAAEPDDRSGVFVVGYPPGEAQAIVRRGRVVRPVASLQAELDPTGAVDYAHLIETTVQIEPGYSGGPMVDRRGRLLGLTVAMAECDGQTYGYALRFDQATVERVQAMIERITVDEAWAAFAMPPVVGLETQPAAEQLIRLR